ncbi:staphylopine uptake ABC transporter ATP-binding protein CntD [Mammaliicoccus sp. JADD-157]|uniref:staphylopine uptake ABC transporter ATP-binding protein CntD n=1 Tax=Mammaliicoccus sp. JADD-157 TaxID=3404818 RepID=UPI003BB80FBC
MTLLNVKELSIMDTWTGKQLVSDINFDVKKAETIGLIGESGSGKSITCKSVMGLNQDRLKITGTVEFEGVSLLDLKEKEIRRHRGRDIAMVMQQGSRAFNPSIPVGKQMYQTMRVHSDLSIKEIEEALIKSMTYMSLKDPKRILKAYPHELSGGMLQRLMIALALSLKPKLIIADEPTTALDTITQYDVLEAFAKIKRELNCAMIFISHDLSVIHNIADRVVVMKDGNIVEKGFKEDVFHRPKHDYTTYLLSTKKKVNDHFKRVLRGEQNA